MHICHYVSLVISPFHLTLYRLRESINTGLDYWNGGIVEWWNSGMVDWHCLMHCI